VVFACERIFARTLFFYWVIARHSIILRAQRKGRGWFRELRFVAGKARKFAQVGEWLKPTDCKSVPPCEVRRFESFPVHQVWFADAGAAAGIPIAGARDRVKRLIVALAAFVALGILSWNTISDQRIRLATLAVLAMFALKTWVRRKDVLRPDGGGDTK
jgi:hypothetical protein